MTHATHAPDTDAQLAGAARLGDREAAGRLVARHAGLAHAAVAALRGVPPTVDHDDLRQAGLIAVHAAARGWRPDRGSKFSTYAFRCVRRAVVRELDAQVRQAARTVPARPADGEAAPALDRMAARPSRPDLAPAVSSVLSALPPGARAVVRMYYGLDGEPLKVKEIGDQLGLSYVQVQAKLDRAIGGLRAAAASAC